MIFVSFQCHDGCHYWNRLEQNLLTLPEHMGSLPDFNGVRVVLSLVFFWKLYCLSIDLRLPIISLVSSSSSVCASVTNSTSCKNEWLQ